jgi:hypothetical protein
LAQNKSGKLKATSRKGAKTQKKKRKAVEQPSCIANIRGHLDAVLCWNDAVKTKTGRTKNAKAAKG